MSKAPVKLEPTVSFLQEQMSILDRFGGNLTFLLMKPLPDQKVVVHAQDPLGFITISGTSLHPLAIPSPARLDNLGFLKSVLELVQKNVARGKSAPLEFETGVASDKATTVIKSIRLNSGNNTEICFRTSDPFQNRTQIRSSKITEWPVKLHMTPSSIEQFEDAARTHLAGAIKADDHGFFQILVEQGEVYASFKSRAGTIKHLMGATESTFTGESAYDIPTFRSVLSAMGTDGGILHIADPAISMETATPSGVYTFVMTKKILK